MSNRSSLWNRREWFISSGLAAYAGASAARAGTTGESLAITSRLYESIGVKPFINAKGTFTILTGSQTLPEVKQAMLEASKHYVHLDELMEAVSRRLVVLTKADWGIVTAGCAAAITHATSACIAGADPERMQRLPKLEGMKNEVIMPRYARNEYDHAARMLGVNMINVNSEDEFKAALGPKTAMVLILSCPAAEKGPLGIENMCSIARSHNVPVLVDAAAETLTIPNIHLAQGATMVAYSGGKCLRGPQAAGLLLGQKDLLQAAWLNSAPHHAFGRSLKVGKEEIMGMLAAVEMWVKRDQTAEWKEWESWLAVIRERAVRVPGVSAEILQPEDLSNHAPQLRLSWDAAKLGITGDELRRELDRGNPRIIVAGASGERPRQIASSVTIMPYMMTPGDHIIVAKAISDVLAHPPAVDQPPVPTGAANVGGSWRAELHFLRGQTSHQFAIEQSGGELGGTHKTEWLEGGLKGEIHGDQVVLRSSHPYEGAVLHYTFHGKVNGDSMEGEVALGEYGSAHWEARRG